MILLCKLYQLFFYFTGDSSINGSVCFLNSHVISISTEHAIHNKVIYLTIKVLDRYMTLG